MTPHPARDEATALVCQGGRAQPYRLIHKALRALMARTLHLAATLDAADPSERSALVAAVDELLHTCADHLARENAFFHAPLRERAPRAVLPFDDDHLDHERSIAALRAMLPRVAEGGAAAPAHAYALYLALTRFVADNLEHMADEESLLTRALWEHFSDAEIHAIEDRLRAQFTPADGDYYLRLMARGLGHDELLGIARSARAGMPDEAFSGLCALFAAELPSPRWARLARALGLPPVPGLAAA